MLPPSLSLFFFFNDPAPTEIYTLSLHDALPISEFDELAELVLASLFVTARDTGAKLPTALDRRRRVQDRKSTRLNSSHLGISYAVFCLKKKKKNINES